MTKVKTLTSYKHNMTRVLNENYETNRDFLFLTHKRFNTTKGYKQVSCPIFILMRFSFVLDITNKSWLTHLKTTRKNSLTSLKYLRIKYNITVT